MIGSVLRVTPLLNKSLGLQDIETQLSAKKMHHHLKAQTGNSQGSQTNVAGLIVMFSI